MITLGGNTIYTVRRLFWTLLAFVLMLSMLSSVALAVNVSPVPEEYTPSYIGPGVSEVCFDEFGNQYGSTGWTSLAAAKKYYGVGYDYYSCDVTYAGNNYNYFFFFDDGRKMFFKVKFDDTTGGLNNATTIFQGK